MPGPICGAPTRSGQPCGWALERCPHTSHQAAREATGAGPSSSPPPGEHRDETAFDPRQQPWYAGRDLRIFAWWVVDTLVEGRLERQTASVLVAVMRVLAALGPEPLSQEATLRDVELLGAIMNGIPPRTPAEWEHAMRLFDDDALEEFARWEPLFPPPAAG